MLLLFGIALEVYLLFFLFVCLLSRLLGKKKRTAKTTKN